MKYFITLVALAVGVALGAVAVVLGEADDSPGLQGLGALLVIGMVVLGVRTVRQKHRRSTQAKLSPLDHTEDGERND